MHTERDPKGRQVRKVIARIFEYPMRSRTDPDESFLAFLLMAPSLFWILLQLAPLSSFLALTKKTTLHMLIAVLSLL